MKKVFISLVSVIWFSSVHATSFVCPSPTQVRCVPSLSTIMTPTGEWKANGGQMTGNTFAPNNQCANIIPLPGSQTRLLCCYTKCGVFIMDVPFSKCTKRNTSTFSCN
jgi:hypothetical protein